MNRSISTVEKISSDQNKSFNRLSADDLSNQMAQLSKSIDHLCHQPHPALHETFQSSHSTLGKLYQLFSSLTNNSDHLLHQQVFDEFLVRTTDGLITGVNREKKTSMNFIQFIKRIEEIAKDNQLSKEYLYEKFQRQRYDEINHQDRNNNARSSSSSLSYNQLLNKYTKDMSHLQHLFLRYCQDNQMNCSTFVQCICDNIHFNEFDIRLRLNGLFYQIHSLLVNQDVSTMPTSLTIDFHGFLLCLQEISRIFHLNLKRLIHNLIKTYHK